MLFRSMRVEHLAKMNQQAEYPNAARERMKNMIALCCLGQPGNLNTASLKRIITAVVIPHTKAYVNACSIVMRLSSAGMYSMVAAVLVMDEIFL